MRTLLFVWILVAASSARADAWLAGNEPRPQPQPHVRPLLGERWTFSPSVGVGWLRLDGTLGGGILIEPTVTHTYDRVELSARYSAMDWVDDTGMHASGVMHRIGGDVGYQIGRVRMERNATFDAVLSAGIGIERIVLEHSSPLDGIDASIGVMGRVLADMDDRDPQRVFYGMEMGVRLLYVPRIGGKTDLGFMFAFGVPVGW